MLITCLFACLVFSCWLWLAFDVMMNTFLAFFCLCCQLPLFRGCGENRQPRGMCLWMMNLCSSAFMFFISPPQQQTLLSLLTSHIGVCFLGLLVYWRLNWKHGLEYVSGVSRPCYSCNISYMQCICSMYILISMHLPLHVGLDAHVHSALLI